MDSKLLLEAGLTDGESKVYLALLKLGSTTTGPIVNESKVANSIIYRILDGLIEKGLVSFIIKEKTRYFQAASPQRIVDYIEERKQKLDESSEKIKRMLPALLGIMNSNIRSSVTIFEGFKGLQTAWELVYSKLTKGDEIHTWGIYPIQEERFHLYWMRDHVRREKTGIKVKMLFNQGTDPEILKNRNSYKGAEARYMPTDIKTPAWFGVYKDVTTICLQRKRPMAVQIIDQEVADSFEAYFHDFWRMSKPLIGEIKL